MSAELPPPTPYPDVNALLRVLLLGVQATLGPRFVGLYLYGSLATGDFDLRRSDVDFLVVTEAELPEGLLPPLAALHARIAISRIRWADRLDGVYMPQADLRRYDPARARLPYLGVGKSLVLAQQGYDWVIQRHVLREHGVVVAGPDLRPLIDPVTSAELQHAVRAVLDDWWAQQLADPAWLRPREYQAYGVLSMCRALYTLTTGALATKPVSARWALTTLEPRWAPLIDRALAWPDEPQPDALPETLDFIRYTLERSRP